jgi:deoxyribose-phosphate aldolase
MVPSNLAGVIDHTLLRPDAGHDAVMRLCDEARTYGFHSVCVQPCWVDRAAERLHGSGVVVCTVIGFPHGANETSVKRFEAGSAAKRGARELDMVINIGAVKSGRWDQAAHDIREVVDAAGEGGAVVKVILECAYLADTEKRRIAQIAVDEGAALVKTSTGFGPHGATIADVRLLREIVGDRCGVKAAGGIRDLEAALAMLNAGASRLGVSAGVSIVQAAERGLHHDSGV